MKYICLESYEGIQRGDIVEISIRQDEHVINDNGLLYDEYDVHNSLGVDSLSIYMIHGCEFNHEKFIPLEEYREEIIDSILNVE